MASFTTSADVEIRLARGTFTDQEVDQCDLLIEHATALIAEAAGKDDDWALALSPVPGALSVICVEVVARAMTVPIGVRSQQETLGSYNHSESYPDQLAAGVALTEAEELRVRRTVHGRTSGSSRPEAVVHYLYDLDDAPGS